MSGPSFLGMMNVRYFLIWDSAPWCTARETESHKCLVPSYHKCFSVCPTPKSPPPTLRNSWSRKDTWEGWGKCIVMYLQKALLALKAAEFTTQTMSKQSSLWLGSDVGKWNNSRNNTGICHYLVIKCRPPKKHWPLSTLRLYSITATKWLASLTMNR